MSTSREYNKKDLLDEPERDFMDLLKERRIMNEQRVREYDKNQRITDERLKELDKITISEKSMTPTQDIIRKYPEDVAKELREHETKQLKYPGMPSMLEIPLPNMSRQYPESPYELKSSPNEFARRHISGRTMRRGGVKKRMTKRGKKKKKKKKQRRRTNKKRYKREV
jgi:hypothetical protein